MTTSISTNHARLRRQGSSDYGYWIAQCEAPECQDANGRPWQHAFSRRTVEGRRLAERDMNEHNQHRHLQAAS